MLYGTPSMRSPHRIFILYSRVYQGYLKKAFVVIEKVDETTLLTHYFDVFRCFSVRAAMEQVLQHVAQSMEKQLDAEIDR